MFSLKDSKTKVGLLTGLICLIFIGCTFNTSEDKIKLTSDFNFNWQFKLEDSTATTADWQDVRLPHDWSILSSYDSIKGDGATAYLLGGKGVYRKNFDVNLTSDQTAYILFDGVYNNATVALNNKELGFHPYGYSPFYYDISTALNNSKNNLLEVSIDRTRYVDSRWYTGSGIYRNVELLVKNKLHIPIWGVFITTPKIENNSAEIAIEIQLKNNFVTTKNSTVLTEIFSVDGQKVASTENKDVSVKGKQLSSLTQQLYVENPMLWDTENPTLYKAVTTINEDGVTVDTQETKFGIRDIRFDVNKGFFLNGENRKIKGVCLHHDAGLVGAAVPKGVWKRRLSKLKAAGCNAIRVSHNPASQEFLDLCDEMGFLVQDEFFDEWDNPKDKRKNMNEQSVDYVTRGYGEHFQEWAERDLKNTVLAHRNHPSIIQWSIGNEIEWTYPRNSQATGFFGNMHWSGNYFWSTPPNSPEEIRAQLNTLPKGKYDIGETAQKLAKWTKELDTTRYVIANCILPSSSYESGYTDALDMVGFSYRRVMYDYAHENYPDKPIMGTENLGQWHEWKAILERPFISGTYLWTGVDYMGEAARTKWPSKGTSSGLLDVAGFEKPSYYMFKSLWNDAPSIHLVTQTAEKSIYKKTSTGQVIEKKLDGWKHAVWAWHNVNNFWNYKENQNIIAEVYSNCETVELFLNGTSLGVKKLADFEDHIYKWAVPYADGELVAKGTRNGKEIETKLVTNTEAVGLALTIDKTDLKADGYDVAHVVAQLIDANGNPVKTENKTISFNVEGDARMLGVDNGAVDNVQDHQSNKIVTSQGRCLMIIQTNKNKSNITVSAASENLNGATITVNSN